MFSTGKYNRFKHLLFSVFIGFGLTSVSSVFAATTLYIQSESNIVTGEKDIIGQGETFTTLATTVDITSSVLNNMIEITGFNPIGSLYPSWSVQFLGPKNNKVILGNYEDATVTPGNPIDFHSPTKPNLSISINAKRCNYLAGRFVVIDV